VPKVSFDSIHTVTAKAWLIKYNHHLCWLPRSRVRLLEKEKKFDVPQWLFEKLDWFEDEHDIDFVMSKEEYMTRLEPLEETIFRLAGGLKNRKIPLPPKGL
jgi:hypothetical protein